jgi:hypothetical protein
MSSAINSLSSVTGSSRVAIKSPGDGPQAAPVFSRTPGQALDGAGQRHLPRGQYREVMGLAEQALKIQSSHGLGGHAVPAPNLSAFPGVRQPTDPLWTVHKSETGETRFCSLEFPPVDPQLIISPAFGGPTVRLNGQKLSTASPVHDLELAATLLRSMNESR